MRRALHVLPPNGRARHGLPCWSFRSAFSEITSEELVHELSQAPGDPVPHLRVSASELPQPRDDGFPMSPAGLYDATCSKERHDEVT